MFALSWVFLAAAIGSLVYGLSQQGLTFIWVSIGASVAAMLFMLAGVLRRPVRPATAGAPYGPPPEQARRPEPAPADERPARKPAAARPAAAAATTMAEPEPAPAERKAPARKPAAKKTAAKASTAKASTAKKTAAAATSDRGQVVALPERGTYHLSGCRIVKGRRDTEKLTRGTAKRRGYNACGICKPAA